MISAKHQLLKIIFVGISSMLGAVSCTKDQVMRITYETLRQQDCHLNSARTNYCDRSYAFEYNEYQQLRRGYLQQINDLKRNQKSTYIKYISPQALAKSDFESGYQNPVATAHQYVVFHNSN